jgi:hypothetical protein
VAAIVVAMLVAAVGGAAAERHGPPRAAPTPPLCDAWRDTVAARTSLYRHTSEDVLAGRSPVETIQWMVVDYPVAVSQAVVPLEDALSSKGLLTATQRVSAGEIRDLAIADLARALNDRPQGFFDGLEGSYRPDTLPPQLREPARMLGEVYRSAVARCPTVTVDWALEKNHVQSALKLRMNDEEFLAGFFADPASLTVLDAHALTMLFATADVYYQALVALHARWFIDLLAANDEARVTLTEERPDLLLLAAKSDPSLVALLQLPPWNAELRVSIGHVDQTLLAGLQFVYGPQLTELGLTTS